MLKLFFCSIILGMFFLKSKGVLLKLFFLTSSFLFFSAQAIPPLPSFLIEHYQIEGCDLINFYQADLDGDEKNEAIWLIWHKKNFQLVYHNHQTHCGQYRLSGDWERNQKPQLLFQNLDEEKGEEILVYKLNQKSPLMEVISFPHLEAFPLLRHSPKIFFDTQFTLSPNGKWILTINYQKRIELPFREEKENRISIQPRLKPLSHFFTQETIGSKKTLIQEWTGLIQSDDEKWLLITKWQLKKGGWSLLETQIKFYDLQF